MAETLGPRLGATARRAFTAAAIAVAAALAACRPSASSVPPSLPDGGAAPVAFALRRCVWRAHGATCGVPEDRRLVVVVEPLVGAATVEVDGATVAVARHEVAGAMSLELRPAIGARRLTVRAGAASGAGEAHFLLMEVPTPAPLVEAQRLRKGGQVAEARALAAELAKTSTDAWARARALGLVARIDRAQGRAASALEALEASAALLDERGEQTLAYRDRMVSAYVEIFETRRLDQALEIIQRVREIALDADGRMSADYHEALVALELGNSREALRLVRAARRSAERALDARMTGDAAQVEAQLLQALGRFAEADRLFARVADGSLGAGDDCRRSMALNNRAWLRLMDLGTSSLESVEPLDVVELVEASLRLKVGPCDVPLSRATALTNLAFGWLERDDIPKARAALIEARRVLPAPDARLLAWWHDVEGRIALREGRPSAARTTYKRLAALAEANALPGPRWRASVGLALAEEALGHVDAAARHHRDAERYLDADARTAPLGEGRSSFLSRFSPATEHHVAFLARVGRADDAADVARRARARLLDALQWAERIERLSPDAQARWASALAEHRGLRAELDAFGTDEWTLPKNELEARGRRRTDLVARLQQTMDVALAIIPSSGAPSRLRAPDPGELLLVFHPTGSRWLGLAIDGRHPTTAVELGPLAAEPTSDEALATALFTPFRAQLAEAKVLTLYPSGGLDARDLHALPFDGRRLVEHLPVRYGIDLPGERTNLALPLRTAFVVADPQGDLPESRAEAETLVHHLRDAGWSVEALVGPAATSLAFAAQLRRGHGLLHYAGHGAFEGIDGWSSALPLAAGVAFGVSDVLASPSVPARVVLSACESGRSEPGGQVASLGLAQAFLVAGAREVVATTRPIRDATARLVAEHLHADPDEPLADGLRRAQQAAWAARVADASAYRVYVR